MHGKHRNILPRSGQPDCIGRPRRAARSGGQRQGARAAGDRASVAGAFHYPMMAGAVPEFAAALRVLTGLAKRTLRDVELVNA